MGIFDIIVKTIEQKSKQYGQSIEEPLNNKGRFERKFFISALSMHDVQQVIKLHPSLFVEIYHQRHINNIYLDTLDLKHYFDNVYGLSQRMKWRIRWYGSLFDEIHNPILELKIKNNLQGLKKGYPLAPFKIEDIFQDGKLLKVFDESNLPDYYLEYLRRLQPTLLNKYTRNYYQSADRYFRVTIDSEQEFWAGEQRSQGEFDAILESAIRSALLVEGQWHFNVLVGHRTTVGPACELRDDGRCAVGFVGRPSRLARKDAAAAWGVPNAGRIERSGDGHGLYRWLLPRVAVLVELRLVGLPLGFDERRILLEERRCEDMWACGDRNVEI